MSLDLMRERERPRHRADVPVDACSLRDFVKVPSLWPNDPRGRLCEICDRYQPRHRSAS